jgi:hypothetical protein
MELDALVINYNIEERFAKAIERAEQILQIYLK